MRRRHSRSSDAQEADEDLRVALPTTQIPVQLIAKLTRRPGTVPAGGVGLHVVVQQLQASVS
jgi:hypothetical protein